MVCSALEQGSYRQTWAGEERKPKNPQGISDPEDATIFHILRTDILNELRSEEFKLVSKEAKRLILTIADQVLPVVACQSSMTLVIYADGPEVELIIDNRSLGRRLAYIFRSSQEVKTFFAGHDGRSPRICSSNLISVPGDLSWAR